MTTLFIPTYVIMHHSLTEDSGTVSWNAIRKYHVNECGWLDIGYQYGIEMVKTTYEILLGRFEGTVGAHTKGKNKDSIGICCVGNFDDEEPDMAQWEVAVDLVENICLRYRIPVENVKGHNEYAPHKTCPGKRFDMNLFRDHLVDRLRNV